MGKIKGKNSFVAMGLFVGISFLFILSSHQVNLGLTQSDKEVFSDLFPNVETHKKHRTLLEEIETVLEVQQKALELSPLWEGIPLGETREPVDLIREGRGICYDRSRFIEKALRYMGFETRHVALYEYLEESYLKSIKSRGIASHSATEVKTSQGWMFVDSNSTWVSLSDDGKPIALHEIRKHGLEPYFANKRDVPDIFKAPFFKVYGLYSRHGNFYPPFNWIPDVSYKELINNAL